MPMGSSISYPPLRYSFCGSLSARLERNIAMRPSRQQSAFEFIKTLAERAAYIRRPNPQRREKDGQKYKKGYEIRLPVNSDRELRQARNALSELGFSVGRPFQKQSQYVLSIYGRDQVARFIKFFSLSSRRVRAYAKR